MAAEGLEGRSERVTNREAQDACGDALRELHRGTIAERGPLTSGESRVS